MEHTFKLRGKLPSLPIPREKEENLNFTLESREHFERVELRVATFTLPEPPGKIFYACYSLSRPRCSDGITLGELESYLDKLLKKSLPKKQWVLAE